MPDVSDLELFKTPDEPPMPGRSVGVWVVSLLLGVAVIAALLFFGYRRPARVAAPETKPASQPADRPLGSAAESITLPPLDQTDAVVRELVKKVSSHPSVAAWLATDDLIRHFAIGVADVAAGKTATKQLLVLRPS